MFTIFEKPTQTSMQLIDKQYCTRTLCQVRVFEGVPFPDGELLFDACNSTSTLSKQICWKVAFSNLQALKNTRRVHYEPTVIIVAAGLDQIFLAVFESADCTGLTTYNGNTVRNFYLLSFQSWEPFRSTSQLIIIVYKYHL